MLTLFKTHKERYIFLLRRDTESYFSSFLGDVYRAVGLFNINDPKVEKDEEEVYSCPTVCVLDRD